ncbi:MAG: MFS transporter [Lachnospiraceae bacterium]|nr:MFS transporter [Lachnospiraceae bacterium]
MNTGKRHYAWTIVAALMVLTFVMGYSSSYAIFMVPVSNAFGTTTTAFGLTYTILTYCEVLGAPICAKLYKKYDGRIIITTGIVMTGLCYLLQGFCTAMWQLYVLNAIQGLFAGILVLQLNSEVLSHWFAINIATIIGVASCLRGIGGAVWNGLGGWLIDIVGWRPTFIIFGAAIMIIGVPFCLLLRKDPIEKGLKPYGIEKVDPATYNEDPMKKPGMMLKAMYKQPAFWIFTITIGVATFCNVLYGYLNAFLQTERGLTSTTAGLCNSALMIGGAIFYIVIGRVFDKSPKLATIMCYAGSIIAYPVLIYTKNMSYLGFLICFFLIGTTYQPTGGILYPAMTRDLGGDKDFTMFWALEISVLNFTGALGSTGWGLCLQALGYEATFTLCAALYAASVVAFIAAMAIGRKKWRKLPEWQPGVGVEESAKAKEATA